MFGMLFTITFFIGIVILLRCICKNHISARVQYAIWLLVAVKLLVFPVPNIEGYFSILGLMPEAQNRVLSEEGMEGTEEHSRFLSEEELREAEASGYTVEVQLAEASADGNLWEQDGQAPSGEMVSGKDTNVGMTPYAEIAGKGRILSKWTAWWQRMGLRLKYYIENTLKVPSWFVVVIGVGSILCAFYMVIYHIRLKYYLLEKGVELTKEQLEAAGAEKLRAENLEVENPGIEKSGVENLGIEKSGERGRKVLAAYSVEGLPTPCLFGKRIYIPARLAEDQELLPYVLQHEMCHYVHGDSFWGFVRMVCVCLYWYHPLVWLAAYLSRQDCELACDEAVIRRMSGQDRKRYGELLLEFALVKSSPADCFSMTTAMSGNARNLKQRLEKITGKKKNKVLLAFFAVALATTGICACVTSGFVSPDKQRQSIRIEQQKSSTPLQQSYEVSYRLSRDAASYGIYLEQYKYGELISADVVECAALLPDGEKRKTVKKGKTVFSRELETDEITGGYVKAKYAYSIPDYSMSDGGSSVFRAFTLELSDNGIYGIGNSFSAESGEKIDLEFLFNQDIILVAEYYGDGSGLSVPAGRHVLGAEKYMEKYGDILKRDRSVILTHLIVSDKTSEELEKELEEMLRSKKAGVSGENPNADMAGAGAEGITAENAGGYSNEELLEMAENYYRTEHGFAPCYVEIDSENDEQVVIWLYDINEYLNVENEITGNAVTRDWYTVDRMTGRGENVLFEEIDLTNAEPLTRKWNRTLDEMTVEDGREQEAYFRLPVNSEAGTENRLYLLGETDHYRLYGTGDYQAMILEAGDSYTEIAIPFVEDDIVLMRPGLQEGDYDGDGEIELAMKLWEEGIGIWEERLWMLDKKDEQVKAYECHRGAFSEQILSELEWEQEDGGKRILLDGQPISPILKEENRVSYEEMGTATSMMSFALQDGKIRFRTQVFCGRREGFPKPAYVDTALEAEVAYYGNGEFRLVDIETVEREDM